MRRDCALGTGIANLSDQVRVIDRDGAELGIMMVAEAQKHASEQGGELYVTEREADMTEVRIVLVRKAPSR